MGNELTRLGMELATLIRRETLLSDELFSVQTRKGALIEEIRRGTTGALYGTQAEQYPHPWNHADPTINVANVMQAETEQVVLPARTPGAALERECGDGPQAPFRERSMDTPLAGSVPQWEGFGS